MSAHCIDVAVEDRPADMVTAYRLAAGNSPRKRPYAA